MARANEIEMRELAASEVAQVHRGRLIAVIRRLISDQAEVEDVLQDVYVEFMQAYDLETAFETLGAWLVRVARNKVLDRLRRRKVRDEHAVREGLESGEEALNEGNAWMQDWIRDELVDALAELPIEQREVFVKHELEGKSFEEIARETGANVNTLLSRKRYAVLALRESLKEVYDELE